MTIIEEGTNETNGQLDNPNQWKVPRKVNITTSIDSEVWQIAKQRNLKWSDALSFGIRFLDADIDKVDWPMCNLTNKLQQVVQQRNQAVLELNELKEKITKPKEEVKEDINKEVDEVFGGLVNGSK